MKSLRSNKILDAASLEQWEKMAGERRWHFDASSLKQEFSKTRIAFDSAQVAVALCDLSGQLLIANRYFQELFSIESMETVLGKQLRETCGSFIDLSFIDELANGGDPKFELMALVTRNGNEAKRVYCQARCVDGSEGVPRWLMITLTVLEDRAAKTAVVEQLKTDFSIAEVLSGIAHWYVPCEPGMEVQDFQMVWSVGATSLFSTRSTEDVPTVQSWLNRVSTLDQPKLFSHITTLATTGDKYAIEYRLDFENGTKYISSQGWRVPDPFDSSRFLLIGTERDITCHYDEEEVLARSVMAFNSIFESSNWIGCIVDKELKMIYANDVFRSLKDYSNSRGNNKLAVLDLLSSSAAKRELVRCFRRSLNGESLAQTFNVHSRSGIEFPYDFTFTPIRANPSLVIGVSVCGQVNHERGFRTK